MRQSSEIEEYPMSAGVSQCQLSPAAEERVIMHVDMDAFYASVEQKERPWLEGKPVVVGGDPKSRRGVVTAASYPARKYGVKAGMPLIRAQRLCPGAIFLVGSYGGKYEYISSRVMTILRGFSPMVEPYSIDEAFVDITGCERLFGPPVELAKRLKEKIKRELDLVCSVGIAPNKLLAKLASSLSKPDGLTVIPRNSIKQLLNPLKVTDLCGIGEKTARILSRLGIHTLGELASYPAEVLKRKFGKGGEWLHLAANGIDDTPVIFQTIREKSLGHERTLPEDVIDPERIHSVLLSLSSQVARRLRARELVARTVTLKVRYSDFVTFTRSKTLSSPTDSEHVISEAAGKLALDVQSGIRKVRLLGVSVSHLETDERSRQTTLSLYGITVKSIQVYSVLDRIRDRFGEGSITWAAAAASIE
jgi:DNA polymerase-4